MTGRVLSGMRPTGPLHIGHYHGVLKNWLQLQHQYECFFFVADWHALTTEYEKPADISASVWEIVIDWLAAGLDPGSSRLFIQSWVPEHAEMHVLLSMSTPLRWLERVPSYKEQQEKLTGRNLTTYGFLGYPLLQAADILLYKADRVPVGDDQLAHVELSREVARHFNNLYGQEPDFEKKVAAALKKMGKKNAALYSRLQRSWRQDGDAHALEKARAMLAQQQNISLTDRERLYGHLEGTGRMILPEPQALLTEAPKMAGLDGQKMSKSYGNTIPLREHPYRVEKKIRTMATDPARVRVTDPGDPNKCPVWDLHTVYSDETVRSRVLSSCPRAEIGCLECKQYVIDAIHQEQGEIRARAKSYLDDPETVRGIINEGSKAAREVARETLTEVRQAMGLSHQ